MITLKSKDAYQAELFSNRLTKKFKQLRKWARRERISCYRLYDRDIPEVPVAVDLYEFLPSWITDKEDAIHFIHEQEVAVSENNAATINEAESRRWLHIFLYERPYEKDETEENAWLHTMTEAACSVLHILPEHVITKVRKKQKGENQYEKHESASNRSPVVADKTPAATDMPGIGLVQECGELFKINLHTYLDTGLFFDHRPLRAVVRATSKGKRILNLFCYTASFSVYAAEGGASFVESVDLSNTYLSWAKENMQLNGFTSPHAYSFTRNDVSAFLNEKLAIAENQPQKNDARYDIIILDPPTFSNSKKTDHILDINRDWADLCSKCLNLLNNGGILYFSTNSKRLIFDTKQLPSVTRNGKAVCITDITDESLPEDFSSSRGTKNRRAWKMQIAQ